MITTLTSGRSSRLAAMAAAPEKVNVCNVKHYFRERADDGSHAETVAA